MRLLLVILLPSVLSFSMGLALLLPSSQHALGATACISAAPPGVPSGMTAIDLPEEQGVIYINEVLTNPDTIIWNCDSQLESDPTTKRNQNIWVELYNPSDWTYNLTNDAISLDEGPDTPSFHFPQEAIIAPHSYFVFFPYTSPYTQTTDQLPTTIPQYRLLNRNTVISMVEIPQLPPDTSYAYFSNGEATPTGWQITNAPTIRDQNMPSQAASTPTKGSTPPKSSGTPGSSGKTKSSSNSSSSAKETNPTKPAVNGTQPAWKTLNRPINLSSQGQEQPSLASIAASPESNLPLQVIISTLAISLIAALYGGIRILTRRRTMPPPSKEE